MKYVSRREALKQIAASPLLLASLPQSDDLLDAVNDAEDLKLLRQMIQTKSYSGSGEESALARIMIDEMKALGLETRLIEVEPGRFNAVGRLVGTGGQTASTPLDDWVAPAAARA